jgi:hypothetical protein
MSDSPISTESTGTTAPPEPSPISAAPTHQSPIDQAKDAAKKVLALITGRK